MSTRGALLNYTTQVDAAKSIEQIQKKLAAHGASAILLEYSHGEVSSVSFKVRTDHGELPFRLPADPAAVKKVLEQQYYEGRVNRRPTALQSRRIAWRILKDWVEAQLALVQVGMARTEQVFLPYHVDRSGKTLYQHLVEGGFKALGSGEKEE